MTNNGGSLAEERRLLAASLRRMADEVEAGAPPASAVVTPILQQRLRAEQEAGQLLCVARDIYAARRRREKYLAARLLGEPVWDIMLDLFIKHGEGKPISTTSACLGSGCPQATALRYLKVLESEGLLRRTSAVHDHRVTYVELMEEGRRQVTNCIVDFRDRHTRRLADHGATTAFPMRAPGRLEPVIAGKA